MVSLVELGRSLDAYGAQSAATPASISQPLPAAKKQAADAPAPNPNGERVTISSEATRQLQRAEQREAEQAAARRAAGNDAETAARMAHELAYRREIIIAPQSAYSNLASSLYVRGTSPASNAAGIAKAQAELDQARLARIALYESEKARGTPAADIFNSLAQLDAARPHDRQLAVIS